MIAALTAFLVGCGGSSGDTDLDTDGDGTIDSEDTDIDGDGIDNFVDSDADGDGFIDEGKTDTDGDGTIDSADLDANGNGILDIDETDTVADACENTGGTDNNSNDAQWNNNCVVSRGNAHSTSYYTRGIQRILFCSGFNEGLTDIGAFADAQFGPTTVLAMEKFQTAEGLTVDGIVGAETWGALQASLEQILGGQVDAGFDAWAVKGDACAGIAQFYQEFDQSTSLLGGWTIANNPGEAQRVQFSTVSPFE
jgi:peptidoglycan hydrolase-like protein with peptidoglycan-binding domain